MIVFTSNKAETELLVKNIGYELVYSGIRRIHWIKDKLGRCYGEWNEISGSGVIDFNGC